MGPTALSPSDHIGVERRQVSLGLAEGCHRPDVVEPFGDRERAHSVCRDQRCDHVGQIERLGPRRGLDEGLVSEQRASRSRCAPRAAAAAAWSRRPRVARRRRTLLGSNRSWLWRTVMSARTTAPARTGASAAGDVDGEQRVAVGDPERRRQAAAARGRIAPPGAPQRGTVVDARDATPKRVAVADVRRICVAVMTDEQHDAVGARRGQPRELVVDEGPPSTGAQRLGDRVAGESRSRWPRPPASTTTGSTHSSTIAVAPW